jgi:histidine triad (HIT) family protein
MYNHQPANYVCPICNLNKNIETEYNKIDDIVYQADKILAIISPKWWPYNPGHVLVVSREHYENIYDIPQDVLQEIITVSQQISIALKVAYECTGTSIRQHNEPAGNQDMWHFHLHVFPRWNDDNLYLNNDQSRFVTPAERLSYATKLRNYFAKHVVQGK